MGSSAPRALAAPLLARRGIHAVLVACVVLATSGVLAGGAAATTLSWAKSPTGQTAKGGLSLSCAATSLCVAVDAEGRAFVASSPGTSYDATWSKTTVAAGVDLTGVSCPSTSACVAVGYEGDAYTTNSPKESWQGHEVAAGVKLTSVSCAPGTTTCVAVAESGDAYFSTSSGSTWSAAADIDNTTALTSVSCVSATLCVAVDKGGNELATTEPTASKWTTPEPIADGSLRAVSCESAALTGACVAIDEATGYAIGIESPSSSPALAETKIDSSPTLLTADSCIPGLCVALEQSGVAFATSTPSAVDSWSETSIGSTPDADADAVACIPDSVCLALAAPTGAAGTLEAFTAPVSQPASESPPPKEAPIGVVSPSPKLIGTPATGQTLTCEPGLPSGATATISYLWLGNETAIAGATNPRYKVRSRNEGEHIQCEVTATNSAGSVTKSSSWVAIPLVKPPSAVGETSVAKALSGTGRASFAVLCSNRAIGTCTIEAKLTLYERIRGTKVVGLSATKPVAGKAKGVAARARRATARIGRTVALGAATKQGKSTGSPPVEKTEEVTIGSLKVTVKPGHERKLSVKLNATGKALAAEHAKGLPAMLTVSGTVIGVMTGKLHAQKLTIKPEAKALARKGKRGKTTKAKVRRA